MPIIMDISKPGGIPGIPGIWGIPGIPGIPPPGIAGGKLDIPPIPIPGIPEMPPIWGIGGIICIIACNSGGNTLMSSSGVVACGCRDS